MKPSEDSTENLTSRGNAEPAAEHECTTETAPSASPSSAPSTKPAENESVVTQANNGGTVEVAEPMDIEHQEHSADVTSVLDLPTTTKADSVDVEMGVPENNPSQVEGDTKERDLEKASEKTEPGDDNLVVAQQVNVQRPEPPSDNDSSATCSADEDVDGEPERQR